MKKRRKSFSSIIQELKLAVDADEWLKFFQFFNFLFLE